MPRQAAPHTAVARQRSKASATTPAPPPLGAAALTPGEVRGARFALATSQQQLIWLGLGPGLG
eukprot:scaffold24191_cov69-Phaeocystis_antarctica.AAC.12